MLWLRTEWKELKQFLQNKGFNLRQASYSVWFFNVIQIFNVMNDNSKVLIGLLAGLAAGAALGLLFAPEKGSDTRDRLSQSLKDLGDSIKDKAADEINNLANLKDKVVSSVRNKFNPEEEYADETEHA